MSKALEALYRANQHNRPPHLSKLVPVDYLDTIRKLKPDPTFWPPNANIEAVILCTASERVAINAAREASPDLIPDSEYDDPLTHQDYFMTEVDNGNGHLKGVALVAHLHGVPMFQMDSEEKGSARAQDEAGHKVDYAAQKWRAANPDKDSQRVLFIARDTVNGRMGAELLNKTMYEPDFPLDIFNQLRAYDKSLKNFPAELEFMAATLQHWMREYFLKNYPEGELLQHTTGVHVRHGVTDLDLGDKLDFVVPIIYPDYFFDHPFIADPQTAGGAFLQYVLLARYNAALIDQLVQEQLSTYRDLVPRSSNEVNYYQWLMNLGHKQGPRLLHQIQGYPHAFISAVTQNLLARL